MERAEIMLQTYARTQGSQSRLELLSRNHK